MFDLHPTLAKDTYAVTNLPLCTVRLMDNKIFPWLILVPQVEGVREWIDLEREQQHQLSDEIAITSHILQALTTPDKLNVAALGNQVAQLHVHVIARYKTDQAWPEPVWGKGREYYAQEEADGFLKDLRIALDSVF
ncbi:MAG: diadenosine tetraphosphate hydrolase [Rickettsiales bacterium]|nr:diadenosine tetraphosphate hydrolase [Rickettsiales bacterium]